MMTGATRNSLLLIMLGLVANSLSVEAAITWHHGAAADGGDIGVGDTLVTYQQAVDICEAEGAVIYRYSEDDEEFVMDNLDEFWTRSDPTNSLCDYYLAVTLDQGHDWPCGEASFKAVCYKKPDESSVCDNLPDDCEIDKELTHCSKTCNVGDIRVRYSCNDGADFFYCTIKCCCEPCKGGKGSGVPPAVLCKDAYKPDNC